MAKKKPNRRDLTERNLPPIQALKKRIRALEVAVNAIQRALYPAYGGVAKRKK